MLSSLRRDVEQDVSLVSTWQVGDAARACQRSRNITGGVEPAHLDETLTVGVDGVTGQGKHTHAKQSVSERLMQALVQGLVIQQAKCVMSEGINKAVAS